MKGWCGVILAAMLMWSTAAMAQEESEEAAQPVEEGEATAINNGAISIDVGVDYTSAYVFRGLLVEDTGQIIWPWIELGFSLFESDGALSSIALTLGSWNSLNWNNDTGTGGPNENPRAWLESDAYATLAFGFIEALEVSAMYIMYASPNGTFSVVKELVFGISYDDSALWEDIAVFQSVSPWIGLAVELENGNDKGTNEGIYMEIGVEPTLAFGDSYTVTTSIPLVVGFSLRDYFQLPDNSDSTWGFFDAGLVVGLPLPFISERYGEWELSGNFHMTLFSDQAKQINDTDSIKVWGGVGLSMSY